MNNLSETLKVRKPERKGLVYYRIPWYGAIDPIMLRPINGAGVEWNAEETIYDPGDETNKTLRWVKSHYTDANKKVVEVLGRIEINESGLLSVDPWKQPELYEYIERSNYLGDNPYRDTSKPIYLVKFDVSATAKKELAKANLEDQAMEIWRKLAREDGGVGLRTYAKAMLPNWASMNHEEIEWNMRVIAKNDPESFIRNSGSKKVEIKALIADAVDGKIISYQQAARSWDWNREKTPFVSVPNGTDETDYLVAWFLDEKQGQNTYREIQRRLGLGSTRPEPVEKTVTPPAKKPNPPAAHKPVPPQKGGNSQPKPPAKEAVDIVV